MQIRDAVHQDKDQWNNFIRTQSMGSFLQSWEWGEFLAAQKEKIWRLIVEDHGEWQAVVCLSKTKLRYGMCVLEAPKGPLIEVKDGRWEVGKSIFEMLVKKVDEIAKQEKALLFQCEPNTHDETWKTVLIQQGFKESAVDSSPRHTLILDIQKSAEELLAEMRQKTRYNIRLARKKGVKIIVDNTKLTEFYALMKKTMQRQGFNYYGEKYYQQLLKLPFVKLYLAKLDDKIIAANIMVFWNKTATYLFGASDYEFRDVMAPHLLQWQAIIDANRPGLKFYDFWGVEKPVIRIKLNPNATNWRMNKKEKRLAKWAGFTKFKTGFALNAEITEYIGTYEKVYQPIKLGIYRFLRTIYQGKK